MSESSSLLCERKTCPVCGSARLTELMREAFAGPAMTGFLTRQYGGRADIAHLREDTWVLAQCQECHHVFQTKIPKDALLRDIYNRWIPNTERERLHQSYRLNDYRYLSEQLDFLIQHLKKPPAKIQVLDFGLGWAEWATMALAYGCQVFGSELSEDRIANAKGRGIHMVELDALEPGMFDFINTEQVFEHLTDPGPVLTRLVAALKPGGLLKISVPDSRRTLSKVHRGASFGSLAPHEIVPIAPLEHLSSFTARTLAELGARHGLRVLRPSLYKLWNGSAGWLSPKRFARLTLRPFYRHVAPKSTFIYFEQAARGN